jgi:4-amino-4-deoxy-L-arabinose transferase-like glycosyltransferase
MSPSFREPDRPLPSALPMTPAVTVCLAVAMAGLFVFSGLGSEPLTDFDEAWHALIALDIERSGDFLSYTEDGRLTGASVKPPLYFWGMALSFRMLGPSEFAARLFSASCYVAMIGCVAQFAQRYLHWTVALTAALLLSTQQAMVYHHGARTADIDSPLILFLTLTMFSAYRVFRGGRAWPIAIFWCAALLTKGLAAVQILPVLVIWLAIERRWRNFARIALALALGTLPAVGFFIIRDQVQPGVLAALLGHEFIGRMMSEVDDSQRPPIYFYLGRLWPSLAPAMVGLVLIAIGVRGSPRLSAQVQDGAPAGPLLRLLLIWTIVPFMLFSLAGTKRVWYVYPSLVPAYILAAWILRAGLHRLESRPRNRLGPLVALVVVGAHVIPATITSLSFHRADYERQVESGRLLAAASGGDERGGTLPMLAYRVSMSNRFVLKRASVRYIVCNEPAEFIDSLAKASGDLIVAYPPEAEAEIAQLRGARPRTRQVRCAQRDVIVETWSAAPVLSP